MTKLRIKKKVSPAHKKSVDKNTQAAIPDYGKIQPADVPSPFHALTKAGVSRFPQVNEAQFLLARTLRKHRVCGTVLDLSAMGGLLASLEGVTLRAVEGSAAALSVLQAAQLDAVAATIGDDLTAIWPEKARTVTLVLAGDRGNDYAASQIIWAHSQTPVGGRLFLAGDKEKGFDRYMRQAAALYGTGEVIAKEGGMRVAQLIKRPGGTPLFPAAKQWNAFDIEIVARAGVFSAAKVDKGTQILLQLLESKVIDWTDKKVLDIGTGTGILGTWAAKQGATVTLIDGDLQSVRSAQDTLAANGLTGCVLHSDVGQAVEQEARFDLILSNPPFHVGRGVLLDVAYEFIALAARTLASGGQFYLVANDFLPYERLLARYGVVKEEMRQNGFKVLSITKS